MLHRWLVHCGHDSRSVAGRLRRAAPRGGAPHPRVRRPRARTLRGEALLLRRQRTGPRDAGRTRRDVRRGQPRRLERGQREALGEKCDGTTRRRVACQAPTVEVQHHKRRVGREPARRATTAPTVPTATTAAATAAAARDTAAALRAGAVGYGAAVVGLWLGGHALCA